MIKDQLCKRIFIPLTGVAFPFLAGHVSFISQEPLLLLSTLLLFTAVSFLSWQLIVALTAYLRAQKPFNNALQLKLAGLPVAGAVVAAVLFSLATFIWQKVLAPQQSSDILFTTAFLAATGGAFLVLLYEVTFLTVEKELDRRVLQQIDKERMEAEANVLKNELDPHFFFNCMNTLSYLVRNDAEKAWQFVHKLSSVYKYFLRNKEKDYVLLQDELEFLENYMFLLRIRFDDSIRISHSLHEQNCGVSILPCALQVVVENAIKHNFFSEKEPLVVSIVQSGPFLIVSNPVRPKMHVSDSTKVGLRNLKARYRMLTNQNVLVQKTNNKFFVKLPIVKTSKYD